MLHGTLKLGIATILHISGIIVNQHIGIELLVFQGLAVAVK